MNDGFIKALDQTEPTWTTAGHNGMARPTGPAQFEAEGQMGCDG